VVNLVAVRFVLPFGSRISLPRYGDLEIVDNEKKCKRKRNPKAFVCRT